MIRPFVVSIALTLAAGAASAGADSYLFDALHGGPYRAAWDKLMKDVSPTPDWLAQFNRNFDGVSGPFATIAIDGKDYLLSFVCKPQDCAARRFEVLFDLEGESAYGALGGRDTEPAFFGAPPRAVQDALAKAIKG